MNKFMHEAIKEAYIGIENGHGGPFGAVIVKNGKVIGKGHNRVLANNDPTAHGEIDAIRETCKNLHTYDLSGCTLYTTGEPCAMCLVAAMWANIEKVYYGATIEENAMIGFRDEKFDKLLINRKKINHYLEQVDHDECIKLFENYNKMKSKKIY